MAELEYPTSGPPRHVGEQAGEAFARMLAKTAALRVGRPYPEMLAGAIQSMLEFLPERFLREILRADLERRRPGGGRLRIRYGPYQDERRPPMTEEERRVAMDRLGVAGAQAHFDEDQIEEHLTPVDCDQGARALRMTAKDKRAAGEPEDVLSERSWE